MKRSAMMTISTEMESASFEWANLIEEILPEQIIEITIEKNLEKGFDYRKITVTGLPE